MRHHAVGFHGSPQLVALLLPLGLLGGGRGGLGATRITPSAESKLEDRKSKASPGELYGPMCSSLFQRTRDNICGVEDVRKEMMKVSAKTVQSFQSDS